MKVINERITRAKHDRLTTAVYDAQVDLRELAQSEKLTLTGLAGWANDPMTILALEGLCRLNDARAQLLVSRYRTLAAARLFDLAKETEGGELARKACVDLLRVSLVPIGEREVSEGAESDTAAGSEPDIQSLRRLLQELGREDIGETVGASGAVVAASSNDMTTDASTARAAERSPETDGASR